jgi:hypothetical protein
MRTRRPKQPNPITLSKEDMLFAKEQQQLVNQYKLVVASLEAAMLRYFEEKYGINLKSESWAIDLDSGTLKRVVGENEWEGGKPIP